MTTNLYDFLNLKRNKNYDYQDLTGKVYSHEQIYTELINRMGGYKKLLWCLPRDFSLDVLEKSYQQDKYFNTRLTPIRKWDEATFHAAHAFNQYRINCWSQSELVCFLKQIARMWILDSTATTTIEI